MVLCAFDCQARKLHSLQVPIKMFLKYLSACQNRCWIMVWPCQLSEPGSPLLCLKLNTPSNTKSFHLILSLWLWLAGTQEKLSLLTEGWHGWVAEEIKLCILYTKYYLKRCNRGTCCELFSPLGCVTHDWCEGLRIIEEFRILALEKFCVSEEWTTMATSCDCINQEKLKSCMDNVISSNKLRWNIKAEG